MSGFVTALAGGAVGSLIVIAAAQISRFIAARSEVEVHDMEARERNEQLVIWVDDETQSLVRELHQATEEFAASGMFAGGHYKADLAFKKAGALHRYRDEEWRARLDLARLRASEGVWHRFWRWRWGSPAPDLTVAATVKPFLDRWRESVTGGATDPKDAAQVFDRTTRTTADALAELRNLKLT